MTGSLNLVNQVFTVLSGPQNSSDSEDIKSALLELLRLIRSGSKQLLGPRMKTFLPLVLDLLKHKEVYFLFKWSQDFLFQFYGIMKEMCFLRFKRNKFNLVHIFK